MIKGSWERHKGFEPSVFCLGIRVGGLREVLWLARRCVSCSDWLGWRVRKCRECQGCSSHRSAYRS